MYTIDDVDISAENVNDASAWLHKAYYWDWEGDYEKAVFCMTKAVELGSVLACDYLGDYYASGEGVAQDYTQAAKLYAKVAACREHLLAEDYFPQSKAAYIIGTYHEKGLLQDASPAQAAEWYSKALDDCATYASPAVALAGLYMDGRGVEQSAAKAFELVCHALRCRLDYGDIPKKLQALCVRLLECEEIAANEKHRLFLQNQADRLRGVAQVTALIFGD